MKFVLYQNKVKANGNSKKNIHTPINRLVELRKKPVEENKDTEHKDKLLRIRKPLKDLDFYINQIKKVSN